jgi:hypothetical protein
VAPAARRAFALEIGNGTALRVTADQPDCLPGCSPNRILRSAVGDTSWQTVFSLPQLGFTTGVDLARTGHQAFVQAYGHVTGGAPQAHSTLLASSDDGTTWTNRGEPCPQSGSAEIDARALTTAPDGAVVVLCAQRASFTSFLAVSINGGATFRGGTTLPDVVAPIGAASARVLFVQGVPGGSVNGRLLRSADGGVNWQVSAGHRSFTTAQGPGFLGFQTPTTGRWVSTADPATIWTTTDAGAHWSPYTFR